MLRGRAVRQLREVSTHYGPICRMNRTIVLKIHGIVVCTSFEGFFFPPLVVTLSTAVFR